VISIPPEKKEHRRQQERASVIHEIDNGKSLIVQSLVEKY